MIIGSNKHKDLFLKARNVASRIISDLIICCWGFNYKCDFKKVDDKKSVTPSINKPKKIRMTVRRDLKNRKENGI